MAELRSNFQFLPVEMLCILYGIGGEGQSVKSVDNVYTSYSFGQCPQPNPPGPSILDPLNLIPTQTI